MKTNPKKGTGERFLDCIHYESCLDFAALQNWKAFNCEQCDYYLETLQKPPGRAIKQEDVRICEKCGKNPTIQPNSPLCASCIGKQAWRDGKRKKKRLPKKKASASPKRKGNPQGQDKEKSKIVDPGRNMEVVFSGKYSQILKEVEKLAEEEVRSLEQQIVYILKNYLSNTQHSEAIK